MSLKKQEDALYSQNFDMQSGRHFYHAVENLGVRKKVEEIVGELKKKNLSPGAYGLIISKYLIEISLYGGKAVLSLTTHEKLADYPTLFRTRGEKDITWSIHYHIEADGELDEGKKEQIMAILDKYFLKENRPKE